MALTRWLPCGTGADDATVGTQAWTNPGNITADDASAAVAAVLGATQTHFLKGTNFGATNADDFGGNVGQPVTLVSFRRKRNSSAGSITDTDCRIVKAGTIQTLNFSGAMVWATGADRSDVISAIPGTTCEALAQSDIVGVAGFGFAESAQEGVAGAASQNFWEFQATYTPLSSPGGSGGMLLRVWSALRFLQPANLAPLGERVVRVLARRIALGAMAVGAEVVAAAERTDPNLLRLSRPGKRSDGVADPVQLAGRQVEIVRYRGERAG
jgi:hypothetical protein